MDCVISSKEITDLQARQILQQIDIDHRYSYEILQPVHVDRTASMFIRSFCDSEPMTRYVNMDYDSFAPFARAVVQKAANDGLSIVALDGGKVIACALTEDIVDPLPMTFNVSPKFKYIFALLEQLTSGFLHGKQFQKKHVAHLFITAVDEDYRKNGLSKQVNFRAMSLAADEGFSFMVSELTNIYNELGIMHHLKNASLLLGSQVYREYTLDGVRPFANLPGGAAGYLWELKCDALLTYTQDNILQKRTLRTFR
ncbi:hypothetical protein AQUSIP_01990 [Aquicella siphonis]|uniref:N-acetyltransferase domain-containing protein n=1 Tax=Aquicella siphonis TaxID=254247 RepID=A0A5E4PEA1_9COXI|nr:hypothetical protein [Aquicella siphonis]VVC74925.1 hypothetical protein AQUSIP_01990 [Aquicella siphonis]